MSCLVASHRALRGGPLSSVTDTATDDPEPRVTPPQGTPSRRVFATAPLSQRCCSAEDPRRCTPAQDADATTRSAQNNDTLRVPPKAQRPRPANETTPKRTRTANGRRRRLKRQDPEKNQTDSVHRRCNRNEKKHRSRRQGTTTRRGRKDPNRRDDAPAAEPHLLPAFRPRFPSSASAGPSSLTRRAPTSGAELVGGAPADSAMPEMFDQRSPGLSRCR